MMTLCDAFFLFGAVFGAYVATIVRGSIKRIFYKPKPAPIQPARDKAVVPASKVAEMNWGVLKQNSPKLKIIKSRLYLNQIQMQAQEFIIRCGVTEQKAKECQENIIILSVEQEAYTKLIATAQPN